MTKMFKRARRNYEQLGGTVEDVVTLNEQHGFERYALHLIAVALTICVLNFCFCVPVISWLLS